MSILYLIRLFYFVFYEDSKVGDILGVFFLGYTF